MIPVGTSRPSAPPAEPTSATAAETTHVDVLIVGAGLSGIGAAHHLQTALPGKSYTQDVVTLRHGKIRDGVMRFSNPES